MNHVKAIGTQGKLLNRSSANTEVSRHVTGDHGQTGVQLLQGVPAGSFFFVLQDEGV